MQVYKSRSSTFHPFFDRLIFATTIYHVSMVVCDVYDILVELNFYDDALTAKGKKCERALTNDMNNLTHHV